MNGTWVIILCLYVLFSYSFVAVTPCTGDPCLNAGTCTISGSNYQCACVNGFSGTNCEGNSGDECKI